MNTCPHCGASLREEAAFCPHCAKSVNTRKELQPPRQLSRRALYSALILFAVWALVLTGWLYTRPKVYDNGGAEFLYTDKDGTCQIVVGWMDRRFEGAERVYQPVEEDSDTLFTFPLCLFFNDPATGENLKDTFLEKVARVTTEIVWTENPEYPWESDVPDAAPEWAPDAALRSSIHFRARSGEAELVWTVEMKNGDVIRLHETLLVDPYPVYRYYPEDTPMETVEELQALADQVRAAARAETNRFTFYEIHLPAVTYEGGLTIDCPQSVHLYGSTDEAGNRTTFTGTVQALTEDDRIYRLKDIDFIGGGSGIGLSTNARVFLTNCRLSGWRTGVLAYGHSATKLYECIVEDNTVGFHYNATGDNIDSGYYDSTFQNNDTAILLEQVPTDIILSFDGTRFTGNGTDIDNHCNQDLDTSGAIFEEN